MRQRLNLGCLAKWATPALLLAPGVAFAASAATTARDPMTYLVTDGPAANPIGQLGWGLIGISLFVSGFITLAVLVGVWWKRSRGGYDAAGRPVLSQRPGDRWLWIGIPCSIVLLFGSAVWTFFVLSAVAEPPSKPVITLDVTAHQWWWEVTYHHRGGKLQSFTTANDIHIPTGKPVLVRLRSADVIHSFWVPHLAGKTDTIPGQTNIAWLEARRPGVYRGQCTEFCGLQHAHMALHVVAQKPAKFKHWWKHQLQPPPATLTPKLVKGKQVFMHRCAICHTVRGAGAIAHGVLGPDLSHIASRLYLGAGTIKNSKGALAGWIANAQALKPGIDMPKENLKSQQLLNLVNWLETLK
jgi:cytochrome c oxidase subunit 2